ncbi:hypothetical protein AUEXF2481DRAFT_389733 [Aureobasidium subglaciale EXF-2481]|uniref:Uncharacterized protein n=1 Tax=Aureobasidium subglaciale (strain EXF-2481) TaxID=1043005 RepID=A0A074ZKP8_AURSE|nr:uncharacterized protein AUEXF2481DRAFT_389733 [Aureobasidium subglaciale EXF-2481]KEQ99026.1 hypothetical protein AUEXF2481DRAFT_389733 [Aureobasidium subglaciale EXF-2481]
MAEPRGAWGRPRGGAARTPQSRSSNASPAPTSSAAAPAKPAASPAPTPVPAGNVWAARAAAQKAPAAPTKKEKSTPAATQAKEEGSLKKRPAWATDKTSSPNWPNRLQRSKLRTHPRRQNKHHDKTSFHQETHSDDTIHDL